MKIEQLERDKLIKEQLEKMNDELLQRKKEYQEQIEKLIARQRKIMIERTQEYKEKEEGRGLVGKQEGRFEIHLADTHQHQYQRLQTKVSFIVVDSKVSLVEEKPKAYNNSNEALPLVTYSNSESTILAYISIFETL